MYVGIFHDKITEKLSSDVEHVVIAINFLKVHVKINCLPLLPPLPLLLILLLVKFLELRFYN